MKTRPSILCTKQPNHHKIQKEFNSAKDQGRIASFVEQTGDSIKLALNIVNKNPPSHLLLDFQIQL